MKKNLSKMFLVLVNLIPIVGVLFFDWTIFSVLFLYWLESAVVGIFNVVKMFKISQYSQDKNDKVAVFAYIPFFIIHYGGFMLGHLFFLIILSIFFDHGRFNLDIFRENFLASLIPILGLIISHGLSHWQNFIGKKEYHKRKLINQMTAPYKRIVLMHFLILILGGLVLAFQQPIWAVLVLVIVKIIFDLKFHNKIHQQLTGETLKK